MRKAKDTLHSGDRHAFFLIMPLFLILAFLVAACGSHAGTPAGGSGSTPTPVSTPTSVASKGAAGGCPNTTVTNPPAAKPNVVIKLNNSTSTVTAHNGDLIEVRLPFNQQWAGPTTSQGVLELQAPSGYLLRSDKVCVWRFVARGTGTTTLLFSGRPICRAHQLCPMYITEIPFTVDVK